MTAIPRTRLGMITPSSNTALEPLTAQLLAATPEITAHFARLRVTEISLGDKALAQFDAGPMLEAGGMLADMLKAKGIARVAFVTPYTPDVQALILETFADAGITTTFSPCLGISENFAFSTVSVDAMDEMVERAAADRPDAILPFCTNLPATAHAARWEHESGILVIDSIAIATYAGLALSGVAPSVIKGWGRLFAL